ncbi:Crp/Fnr family transcriptional regulator [Cohnella massiliensis]|uniref:Crp/Fnr family transcriptional regulator n=1 Tax=Cohnella massiliensis TaxID=1816691 RepID=UPI001593E012|nr:Crp/Fnr family transcriptional regulator [Cohnella massiliensis]
MIDIAKLEAQRTDLMSRGTRQFRKKNSVIYHQGGVGDGVYWVEKGLVKIKTCSVQGDVKNINIIGPGECFGELALIQAPSIATAIALEDSVLYFLTVEKVRSLFSDFDSSMTILHSLLTKMRGLVETAFHTSAEQQIAHALLQLSEHSQERKIAMKQKDLAEHTGLTRMTINTVLKKWKTADIIDIQNKIITIKNAEALDLYSRSNGL